MKPLLAAALSLVTLNASAQAPVPAELLEALDRNMVFETRTARTTMRITREDGRVAEKQLEMKSRGHETAFTEFLAPRRDKGTRYLKLDDNLWMWLPTAEKQIKISGHMLRQSLMGSDFSYEDMLESPDMASRYEATLEGEESVDGRDCWRLKLTATREGVTYPQRMVWLDQEKLVPIRQELFALTGKKVKLETFHDFQEFGEGDTHRHYPRRLVMRNLLQKGTQTEIVLDELAFGVEIPEELFSLSNLKRGR